MLKLWLDDERPAPEGWHHVKSAALALALIRTGRVAEASLDHDLGHETRTGYWLLSEIERDVVNGFGYALPIVSIHTANPVGYRNMNAARDSIQRLTERKATA